MSNQFSFVDEIIVLFDQLRLGRPAETSANFASNLSRKIADKLVELANSFDNITVEKLIEIVNDKIVGKLREYTIMNINNCLYRISTNNIMGVNGSTFCPDYFVGKIESSEDKLSQVMGAIMWQLVVEIVCVIDVAASASSSSIINIKRVGSGPTHLTIKKRLVDDTELNTSLNNLLGENYLENI